MIHVFARVRQILTFTVRAHHTDADTCRSDLLHESLESSNIYVFRPCFEGGDDRAVLRAT